MVMSVAVENYLRRKGNQRYNRIPLNEDPMEYTNETIRVFNSLSSREKRWISVEWARAVKATLPRQDYRVIVKKMRPVTSFGSTQSITEKEDRRAKFKRYDNDPRVWKKFHQKGRNEHRRNIAIDNFEAILE